MNHRWSSNGRRLRAAHQNGRDDQVAERDERRLTETDGLAVHEAEEGEHGPGQCEARSLAKGAVDDKDCHRAQPETAQDRPATHDGESLIEDADLRKLV